MDSSSPSYQRMPTQGEFVGRDPPGCVEASKSLQHRTGAAGASAPGRPALPPGSRAQKWRRRRPARWRANTSSQRSLGGSSGDAPLAHGSPDGHSHVAPSLTEKLENDEVRDSDKESTCDTGGREEWKPQQSRAPSHRPSSPWKQEERNELQGQKPKEDNQQRLEKAVSELLKALPEEALSAEVLQNTPRRLASALLYFTKGYSNSVKDVIGDAVYESAHHKSLIAVRDLDVSSICEHHLLPFFGKCHIVYLPDRHIVGLSKLPRIIEVFERRLQMQERLTAQIAEGLEEAVAPRGVLVMMDCSHACVSARGVERRTAKTTTIVYRGIFEEDAALRSEALALIR